MFDVACIGIIVADIIAKPVDDIPASGRLELIDTVELHTGGCAANAAINMAKIGLNVTLGGKIGNDFFGSSISHMIKSEGVDISGVVAGKKSITSSSIVLSHSSGERSFLHCFGANAEFKDTDINLEIINEANIIFIAGALLMPAFDGESCAKVLEYAKKSGKYTVMDTAWDSQGRWMEVIKPCLRFIDYFIPSYEEAAKLSGKENPEEIADYFLSQGVKVAVIKLGKDGCFIKTKGNNKHTIPTYAHIKAVDTTGAGDSFAAGFITGLVKGWSLYDCGRFANAVGAHCVMSIGASSGIRKLEEIQEFMRQNEGILEMPQ